MYGQNRACFCLSMFLSTWLDLMYLYAQPRIHTALNVYALRVTMSTSVFALSFDWCVVIVAFWTSREVPRTLCVFDSFLLGH